MSIVLFKAVEILFDAKNQPWIHRAQFGSYLGLTEIRKSIPDDMKREQLARSEIEDGGNPFPPLGRLKNPHDKFISSHLAILIAMRCDKENAKHVREWLLNDIIPHGFNKLIQGKEERIQALNYENVGLQGEIRAKDQQILMNQNRIEDLIANRYVDHAADPGKDNIAIIIKKHTIQDSDKYHNFPYYVARIQKRNRYLKLQWFQRHFPDYEVIVEIDNPNAIHAFNRLEEEGHVERHFCHFRLVDLTRDDLYNLGVPAIEA